MIEQKTNERLEMMDEKSKRTTAAAAAASAGRGVAGRPVWRGMPHV
ncbi:MAG: hypothetical protein ABSF83_15685 [Nitrososphaerales archaeon]